MSKGLEALIMLTTGIITEEQQKEYRKIIEKELKEYEGAKNHIEALHKERVENSLKIKALEIIKDKKVDVLSLLCGCNFDEYNRAHEEKGKLTKEEYDLLKEILL